MPAAGGTDAAGCGSLDVNVSQHATNFSETVRSELLERAGQEVSYTPAGEVAKAITAVLPAGFSQTLNVGQDGTARQSSAEILIDADATSGIASPAAGDAIAVNSVSYVVNEVLSNYGDLAKLRIVRSETVQRSGRELPLRRM